jgi:hypothetical protein
MMVHDLEIFLGLHVVRLPIMVSLRCAIGHSFLHALFDRAALEKGFVHCSNTFHLGILAH